MGHRKIASFACFFLVLCATSLRAEIPGAADPNAYTEHDFRRALLAFHRRTSLEAYEKVGRRDPKWDAAVRVLFEAMSQRFAYWNAYDNYRAKPQVTLRDLIALDNAVQNTGCSDPLAAYFHAVVLADQDAPLTEVRPLFERASKELLASGYPITRAWGATYRWFDLFSDTLEEAAARDAAFRQLTDLTIRMVSEWEYQDVDRRIIDDAISEWIGRQSFERQKQLADAIDAGGDRVDPWFKHLYLGWHAIETGWKARGSGYANTVTEQGWQRFQAALASAEQHLTAAHALHPEYPEAASQMIRVAMGRNARDLRKWFDATMRAQIDFTPAFDNYLWALMPRWHGSHALMYDVGVECLDTGRFDTRLPWQVNNALQRIAKDEDVAFWQRAGVYENLKRMCDGYSSKFGVSSEGDWYRSYLTAVQWRTRRFAECVAGIDALEDRFQLEAFDSMRTMRGVAIGQARAISSSAGKLVETAEQHAASGEVAEAISSYRDAFNSLPEDHRGRAYIADRIQVLQWKLQFDKGSWVKFHPSKDLTGWYPQAGKWEVDDSGALIGTFDDRGLMLLCQSQAFGDSFEVEGTVDLGDESVAAGLGVAPIEPTKVHGLYFWRDVKKGKSEYIEDFSKTLTAPIELQRVNKFRIVVADGIAGVFLNDKPAIGNKHLDNTFRPTTYIGVGGKWAAKPGLKIRFTDLRIKRHDGPPEPTSADYVKPTMLGTIREKTGGFPTWDVRTFAALAGIVAIGLAVIAAIVRARRRARPAQADVIRSA